jgi:hypothetical protein
LSVNFLDEGRDVDVDRAGADAGGVETKEATAGFDECLLAGVRRRDVREIGRDLAGAESRTERRGLRL